MARLGVARQRKVARVVAKIGGVGMIESWRGRAWHGMARQVLATQDKEPSGVRNTASEGMKRLGVARRVSAWNGKS